MVLIRLLTAECLIRNVRVFAKHVRTHDNDKADMLSRLDLPRFWNLASSAMNLNPSEIQSAIWSIEKLWKY